MALTKHARFSKSFYCSNVWANTSKCNIKKFQAVQNFACRIVDNVRKYDHVTPIHTELNWLLVASQLYHHSATMAFKCLTNCARVNLSPKFIQHSEISGCDTRSSQKLDIPLIKTATGQRTFYYRIVNIWNSLDCSLKLSEYISESISVLVNRMASNCTSRVKYVDDATVMEFVPRLSPSYLNFTVSDIYSFTSSRGMVLNGKKCKEMCISFLQYCPFPPAPLLVGSSLIEKVSCYKLLRVHLSDNLTWNEHVNHIVKKGSKRPYAIHALTKCGLTDRQLVLVYCSIIRSVLEYASPAWAGLMQYFSDQIESIQKRALKIIFPSLCYEDALKK